MENDKTSMRRKRSILARFRWMRMCFVPLPMLLGGMALSLFYPRPGLFCRGNRYCLFKFSILQPMRPANEEIPFAARPPPYFTSVLHTERNMIHYTPRDIPHCYLSIYTFHPFTLCLQCETGEFLFALPFLFPICALCNLACPCSHTNISHRWQQHKRNL